MPCCARWRRSRARPSPSRARQWQATRTHLSLAGQRFDLTGPAQGYRDLFLPLLGAHQVANATVAVAALHGLRAQGVPTTEAALRAGLAQVAWPARVEVLQRAPLVVADGAHTRESIAALERALREASGGWRRATLLLGFSADKAPGPLLEAFRALSDRLILVRSRHPRAADPASLAAHPALSGADVRVIPPIAEALRVALAEAEAEDLIVAAGSLFVAAEARALILGLEE